LKACDIHSKERGTGRKPYKIRALLGWAERSRERPPYAFDTGHQPDTEMSTLMVYFFYGIRLKKKMSFASRDGEVKAKL
jgi:hypothetical protein